MRVLFSSVRSVLRREWRQCRQGVWWKYLLESFLWWLNYHFNSDSDSGIIFVDLLLYFMVIKYFFSQLQFYIAVSIWCQREGSDSYIMKNKLQLGKHIRSIYAHIKLMIKLELLFLHRQHFFISAYTNKDLLNQFNTFILDTSSIFRGEQWSIMKVLCLSVRPGWRRQWRQCCRGVWWKYLLESLVLWSSYTLPHLMRNIFIIYFILILNQQQI